MKHLKIIMLCLLIMPTLTLAVDYFSKGKSPFDLKREGNVYGRGNTYFDRSPNNPYSPYRSPYDPRSVDRDAEHYAAPVIGPNWKKHGNVSSPFGRNSVLNPYNQFGNPYSKKNETFPYDTDSNENPYGQYRNPNNPQSVSRYPRYGVQVEGRRGEFRGTIDNLPYHSQSILNPYSKFGNPYNKQSIRNPYRAIQKPER